MLPLNWTSLQKLHDHFATIAVALLNKEGAVNQQLFIVGLDKLRELGSIAVLPNEMMALFYRDETGKDLFAGFLKTMLTEGHPIRRTFIEQAGFEPVVLVQICEAWAHQPKDSDFEDEYLTGKKRVSQSPARTEVVLITLHLREGSIPVVHPIETSPTRRCVRGDFPSQENMPLFSGRFAMQDAFGPEDSTLH